MIIIILIMILLPMIITIRVSKLSHKLLFLVPIIELGIVSIFNAIINHNGNGGVRFDILWLIVGAIVGTIFPLIFLIMKKQNVMLILSIVILLFELSMLISEKSNSYIAVKILPFYIGVVALSFQKDKTK